MDRSGLARRSEVSEGSLAVSSSYRIEWRGGRIEPRVDSIADALRVIGWVHPRCHAEPRTLVWRNQADADRGAPPIATISRLPPEEERR